MIIELRANMKLNDGSLMRKGRYNDAEKPFPQEIYDEIELNKTRIRNTIEVLSVSKPNKPVEQPPETTMIDPGDDTVKTGPELDPEKEEEEKEEVVPKAAPKTRKVRKVTRKKK